MPTWYLLDGSIMVALPDILIVKGQHFVTLPLNHLAAEAGPVVLGGRRTCDCSWTAPTFASAARRS